MNPPPPPPCDTSAALYQLFIKLVRYNPVKGQRNEVRFIQLKLNVKKIMAVSFSVIKKGQYGIRTLDLCNKVYSLCV